MSRSSDPTVIERMLTARELGMPEQEAARWEELLVAPCGCGPSAAAGSVAVIVAAAVLRRQSPARRAALVVVAGTTAAVIGRLAGIRAERRLFDARSAMLDQRIAELRARRANG